MVITFFNVQHNDIIDDDVVDDDDDYVDNNDGSKVFSNVSCDELVITLSELLIKIPRISVNYKGLKTIYVKSFEHHKVLYKEIFVSKIKMN